MGLMIAVFVMVVTLVVMVGLLVMGRRTGLDRRVDELAGKREDRGVEGGAVQQLATKALPKLGAAITPEDIKERTQLQARLHQAGLYSPTALPIFLGVKMILLVIPAVIGLALGFLGVVELRWGLVLGACLGIVGLIGPSFWLDSKKKSRHINLRRALPDCLDVLVICLEGGLSLPAALQRVADELRVAHPLLSFELNIVQREIQLGQPTGESLKNFAKRTDLEEIRGLAAVVLQAEKYGASMGQCLADSCRHAS